MNSMHNASSADFTKSERFKRWARGHDADKHLLSMLAALLLWPLSGIAAKHVRHQPPRSVRRSLKVERREVQMEHLQSWFPSLQ